MMMRSLLSVASLAVLGACEGESNATGPGTGTPEPAVNEVVSFGPLNASSTDTLVYFSFASGALVPRTGDWDLAFRRYEVRLNSPAVGGATSKNVLGFALDNNKTASDAQVLAFTPAATLTDFDAVRTAQIPADGHDAPIPDFNRVVDDGQRALARRMIDLAPARRHGAAGVAQHRLDLGTAVAGDGLRA